MIKRIQNLEKVVSDLTKKVYDPTTTFLVPAKKSYDLSDAAGSATAMNALMETLLVVGIGAQRANEFDIRKDGIYLEQTFEVSDDALNVGVVEKLNEIPLTNPSIENADMPRVTAGYPVVAIVPDGQLAAVKKYYNGYMAIPKFFDITDKDGKKVGGTIVVGISNTSEDTDYHPFVNETIAYLPMNIIN